MPVPNENMYRWRKWTEPERAKALAARKARKFAWHAPPHLQYEGDQCFLLTATCYEHNPIIGKTSARMAEFESKLVELCQTDDTTLHAWCLLPNHYHLLIRTGRIHELQKDELGKLHGATSFIWNGEDKARGRKVWYKSFERPMKSSRHFWASMNYVHHNAIKHGYVSRWRDWPYTSAHQFLETFGPEKAAFIWRKYPVLDYGKDWDLD
jgi:putative transposase